MITVGSCKATSRRGRLRSQHEWARTPALPARALPARQLFQVLICAIVCVVVSNAVNAQVRTTSTEIRYLSGTGKDDAVLWDFFCTEGRNSAVWSKIHVPSNWETEGFGAYQYGGDHQRASNSFPKEQGKYKQNFDVPIAWKNRVVRLVFEGSMTDTEVWINGTSAGPVHQGSFYRFKYDVSPLLKFGQTNLLEVTVSKESSNASVNNAERRGDYWNFGGIFRPVYLEALPNSFIDWTAIDARADGRISIDVNLGGLSSVGSRVVAQIITSSGQPVGESFSSQVLRDQNVARLQAIVTRPNLWTAETPNLYRVRLTLLNGTKAIHTITERFGFRTFEVRKGDGLYLNGRRILLKGVNRHSFWPETARTLSKKISYDDVKLIKEMNMNAVRMSHYPPDAHFLEACDELGLYVLDELGGWHHSYDTPTGQRLIGQMIRRDVNHPSILFWDNGNEGGWNKENDDEFARWDPQKREVLHPWEKFRLVNTDHYEKFDSHTRLSNGPDIYMPTEFLHGLYDGGIGAGMSDYWELIRTSKVGGGGFFWALLDECVKRTDQNGRLDCAGNRGPDGIVGPHREREGSFNTVREIWSPVQIKGQLNGSSVKFDVENRFDFTNLNQCAFEWTLAQFSGGPKAGHKVIAGGALSAPNVGPHNSGQLQLTLPASRIRADVLYLTVKDPLRHELWTWSWSLANSEPKPIVSTRAPELTDNGNTISIRSGRIQLIIGKDGGTITRATIGGNSLLINSGPSVIAYRRNDRSYANVAGESRLTHFESRKEANAVVVEASYEGALKYLRWRFSPSGQGSGAGLVAQLEYEYSFDGPVDILGIQFDADEKLVRSTRWLGMGPYRVWQNRLQGTRLDVWKNGYNDSMPGERWIYPEFKGYFRDVRWADFVTASGVTSLSTASSSYLGLFKPRDGVDGLLDFPDVGIAVLDVIPAMRNKFHTTDEIGPQSKAKQMSGTVKRTIQLRF